jgi:hypothetical protein
LLVDPPQRNLGREGKVVMLLEDSNILTLYHMVLPCCCEKL